MNSLGDFYKNRRVLLTGHTGFKGGWLSLWLQLLGAEVSGISLPPPTKPSLFAAAEIDKSMNHIVGDIRDVEKVSFVIEKYQPEVIFHLAAQPLVSKGYSDPYETYSTNVLGTVSVLDAARKLPSGSAVIVVTTDKCYENKEWIHPYRENDRLGGKDPYSSSKACAELVTSAYRKSFFEDSTMANIATVRAGNVIGGGDWSEDRIVPDIVTSIINNRNIGLRSPNAIRPWQHVFEPLYGYLVLAMKLCGASGSDFAESWNFGPNDSSTLSVRELTERFIQLWGADHIGLDINQNHIAEAHRLGLSSVKARELLGWTPKLDQNEALSLTVDWYKSYYNNPAGIKKLCIEQLEAYGELAPKGPRKNKC